LYNRTVGEPGEEEEEKREKAAKFLFSPSPRKLKSSIFFNCLLT
jgi:hypothetical protein